MIQKALEFEIWKANKAEAKNTQTYSLYLTEGDSFSKTCLKNLKQQVGQNITFNWGKPVGNQAGHCVVQVTSRIMFINKHEQQVDSKQINICEDILRNCIITHHP